MANLSRRSGLGEGIEKGVSRFLEQYNLGKKRKADEDELKRKLQAEQEKQDVETFERTGSLGPTVRLAQKSLARKMAGQLGPAEAGEEAATQEVLDYRKALLGKMTKAGRSGGTDPTALNNAQLNVAIKNLVDQKEFSAPDEWTDEDEQTLGIYKSVRLKRGKGAGGSYTPRPEKEPPPKAPGFLKRISNASLRGVSAVGKIIGGSDLRIVLPSGKVAKAKDQSAYDEAIRKGAKPFQP